MEKQLEQLSSFINRVASDVRLRPTHTSVYLALCDSWIGSRFSETFQVSRRKLMRAAHIQSIVTYHKVVSELQAFGIHETNISEHELNKLRAGNKHAQRDTANAQGSAIKYGQLPDSTQTDRLYIFSPSFAAGINKHANQSSESQPGRVVKAVPEIQKSISLASLFDPR